MVRGVVLVTLLLISKIGLISVLVPTLLQDIIEMSANGEIVADWWDWLIEIYGVCFLSVLTLPRRIHTLVRQARTLLLWMDLDRVTRDPFLGMME